MSDSNDQSGKTHEICASGWTGLTEEMGNDHGINTEKYGFLLDKIKHSYEISTIQWVKMAYEDTLKALDRAIRSYVYLHGTANVKARKQLKEIELITEEVDKILESISHIEEAEEHGKYSGEATEELFTNHAKSEKHALATSAQSQKTIGEMIYNNYIITQNTVDILEKSLDGIILLYPNNAKRSSLFSKLSEDIQEATFGVIPGGSEVYKLVKRLLEVNSAHVVCTLDADKALQPIWELFSQLTEWSDVAVTVITALQADSQTKS